MTSQTISKKSPYEIRLNLLQEARLILQARSKSPETMPEPADVVRVAEELNKFVSKKD